MPREMVAVSMTRETVVMMALREMGTDRLRICRQMARRPPLDRAVGRGHLFFRR